MLRVARHGSTRTPPARPSCSSASAELDGGLRGAARAGTRPSWHAHRSRAPRALQVLADRLPLDVTLDVPEERLPEHLEATAYYIASEALTNVVKHAHASGATVTVTRLGSIWRLEVRDNGRGAADPAQGRGSSVSATAPKPWAGRCRS